MLLLVAPERLQEFSLFLGFHAFGDHARLERMRERGDGHQPEGDVRA